MAVRCHHATKITQISPFHHKSILTRKKYQPNEKRDIPSVIPTTMMFVQLKNSLILFNSHRRRFITPNQKALSITQISKSFGMDDEERAVQAILQAQAHRILQVTQARAIQHTLSKGLCKKNSLEIYEQQQSQRVNRLRQAQYH